MLWRCSDLDGYEVEATDGAIGAVDDLLFDDLEWTIRWLVVDTGAWLSGRYVLLPPSALGHPDVEARRFPVTLARSQVEASPPIDTDRPLSRRTEADTFAHYGWTPYWSGDYMPPTLRILSRGGPGSGFLFPPQSGEAPKPAPDRTVGGDKPATRGERRSDPHLRSVGDTTGHALSATDGDIGHVEDFLADEVGWVIRYLIVDTRNWLPGRRVLLSPQWIRAVDWTHRQVRVEVSRQAVKESPPYDPSRVVQRSYESDLHNHYGFAGYWL